MPDICVASHHSRIRDLLADAEFRALANKPGFLVELRLDQYTDLCPASEQEALNVFAPNCVVTCRHPEEGGGNTYYTDVERVNFLRRAAESGAKFVDVEGRTSLTNFDKCGAKAIRSFHDFHRVPPLQELKAKWDELAGSGPGGGADVVKIAVMPQTIHDTLPLFDLLEYGQSKRVPTMILAMGEVGLWTRVLAGKFGSPFTFGRGEGAPGTAPGQPTWRELDELYRFQEIGADWPVYAVIGNPIGHSLSPLMHNTGLKAAGLKGVYLPLKIEGPPEPVLNTLVRAGLQGVSITIPHKEAVMRIEMEKDPVARQVGAVNTLARRTERKPLWYGMNTDAVAAADSLVAVSGSLDGKNVAILGAGGAARAVAFGVKQRGARVFIVNRTPERAESLAREVGGAPMSIAKLVELKPDVIVNTTPLGMHPNTDASPLEKAQIPQGSIVFDTVYNPLRTKLLQLAEERGCRTIGGLEMFVGQGVRQFELWTKATAPREVMHDCVLKALRERQKH